MACMKNAFGLEIYEIKEIAQDESVGKPSVLYFYQF